MATGGGGGTCVYFIQLEDITSPKSLAGGLWKFYSDEITSAYDARSVVHMKLWPFVLEQDDSKHVPLLFPKDCARSFSQIDSVHCQLLVTVKMPEVRLNLFRQALDLLNWAAKLTAGSRVGVRVKDEERSTLMTGIIRHVGCLHASTAGWYFGIELDPEYEDKGTSDGEFKRFKYFDCKEDCAVFVSVNKLERLQSASWATADSAYSSDQSRSSSSSETEMLLTARSVSVEDMVRQCPLRVNDRVIWMSDGGPESAVVRWVGVLPDARPPRDPGELTVGVEFDNPIGSGTGRYKSQTLFTARRRHASLVPIMGLIKESDFFPRSQQLSAYVSEDGSNDVVGQGASAGGSDRFLPDVVKWNASGYEQRRPGASKVTSSQSSVDRKGWVQPPSVADADALCGTNRGIQSCSEKCTIESLIFVLFAFFSDFDKKLFAAQTENLSGAVKSVLVEQIVNPLRATYYVSCDKMERFAELFTMIQSAKLAGCAASNVALCDDPSGVISTMLGDLLQVEPLFGLSTGSSYVYEVDVTQTAFSYPSLQHVLECSVAQNPARRLTQYPHSVFIVHVDAARFAKHVTCGRIFPCSVLDVSSVHEHSVSACKVCGLPGSTIWCGTCFVADSRRDMTDAYRLSEYAFCEQCFNTYHHQRSARQNHKPYTVNSTESPLPDHTSQLELFAIVALINDHYVSFVKVASGDWLMYDARVPGRGGGSVPEVRRCHELDRWLRDIPAAERADTLPEIIVRLTSTVRLCFYRPRQTA